MSFAAILLLLTTFVPPAPEAAYVPADVRDVRTLLASNGWQRTHLRIRGRILASVRDYFILRDNNGDSLLIGSEKLTNCKAGDIVRTDCDVRLEASSRRAIVVFAKRIFVDAHTQPVEPRPLRMSELTYGNAPPEYVTLQGVVTDVIQDEADAHYTFLIVKSEGIKVAVPIDWRETTDTPSVLAGLLDEEVSVTGICIPYPYGDADNLARLISIDSPNAIRRLRVERRDPFAARPFDPKQSHPDQKLSRFPHRQLVSGIVTAVRNDGSFYLKTDGTTSCRVRPFAGTKHPRPNAVVSVSGFVSSNKFFLDFLNAEVRIDGVCTPTNAPAQQTTAKSVLVNNEGKPEINYRFDGTDIILTGIVKDISGAGTAQGKIFIDSDGFLVPIETGALGLPELGSRIQASGICAITTEGNSGTAGLSRLSGFVLVVRDKSDIRILARPPWWTVGRLFAAVCILLVLLLGIFVWNRILQKIIERRSRALLKERIAGVSAALKADERTRLSVELHDSFSQNLTGISFRIDAAAKAAKVRPELVEQHLDTAKRMLLSCREELRDCISDLRNDVYGEKDVGEAIRKTVLRHIGDCSLNIDCQVARNRLSDMTMHTLLMIVRELTANAVRHGQAKTISVSVVCKDDGLHLSVSDDGCGFDPQNRPGAAEGHFGLQGISDRIALVEGTFRCESAAGSGSRFTIIIPERKST